MKLEINKKYVPHSKSVGKSLECSTVWTKAKLKNQPYLYYTGCDYGAHCFSYKPCEGNVESEWFLPTDVTEYIEESNKTITMSFEGLNTGIKFNVQPEVQCQLVENEFIVEAYNEACSEWKQKLSAKFPSLNLGRNEIEKAVEKIGKEIYPRKSIEIEGNYVKIPLPNANTDWTFKAFEYVKKFCGEFPKSYPVFYNEKDAKEFANGFNFDYSKYLYILFVL